MEILTKVNLVGARTAPAAISRTFTPLLRETRFSLVRIHFSHPEPDGKSSDVGVGGRIRILMWGVALPKLMWVPESSPTLHKNHAPMGQQIASNTGTVG